MNSATKFLAIATFIFLTISVHFWYNNGKSKCISCLLSFTFIPCYELPLSYSSSLFYFYPHTVLPSLPLSLSLSLSLSLLSPFCHSLHCSPLLSTSLHPVYPSILSPLFLPSPLSTSPSLSPHLSPSLSLSPLSLSPSSFLCLSSYSSSPTSLLSAVPPLCLLISVSSSSNSSHPLPTRHPHYPYVADSLAEDKLVAVVKEYRETLASNTSDILPYQQHDLDIAKKRLPDALVVGAGKHSL